MLWIVSKTSRLTCTGRVSGDRQDWTGFHERMGAMSEGRAGLAGRIPNLHMGFFTSFALITPHHGPQASHQHVGPPYS